MKFTHINVQNTNEDLLGGPGTISLYLNEFFGANGYMLKDIQGLDPSPTVPYTAGFSTDGKDTPIVENLAENKEVTFKIGFNLIPGGAASSYSVLRDKLYDLISREVRILFFDGPVNPVGFLTGRIKNCDVPLWSNQAEVVFTVGCDYGLIQGIAAVNILDADIGGSNHILINYTQGTAATGFSVLFDLLTPTSYFELRGNYAAWLNSAPWRFRVDYAFLAGDKLSITTIDSLNDLRQILLLRGVTQTDITAYLAPNSIWPKLHPGGNDIEIVTTATYDVDGFGYFPMFWGL